MQAEPADEAPRRSRESGDEFGLGVAKWAGPSRWQEMRRGVFQLLNAVLPFAAVSLELRRPTELSVSAATIARVLDGRLPLIREEECKSPETLETVAAREHCTF